MSIAVIIIVNHK